jgi:lysyl-tRNA synthetase class 2
VRRLNPHFQIESLLRFNAKFRPRWVPRSVVYRSLGDLAAVATAAARVEGFLSFTSLFAMKAGREAGTGT